MNRTAIVDRLRECFFYDRPKPSDDLQPFLTDIMRLLAYVTDLELKIKSLERQLKRDQPCA